jgi:two-component sensor histidine kinase/HAMP domain-containing protein
MIKDFFRKSLLRLDFTGFPRISILFILLILAVVVNAVLNIYYISKEKSNLEVVNEQIIPFNENLVELKFIVLKSKMYSTNWVYLQAENESKQKLLKLINEDYPELRKRLLSQSNISKIFYQQALQDSLVYVFNSCEMMFHHQRTITNRLSTFSDYENPTKKFECEELVEAEILPRAKMIQDALDRFIELNTIVSSSFVEEIKKDSVRNTQLLVILSFFMVLFVLSAVYFIFLNINRPVQVMKDIVEDISLGELKPIPVVAEDTAIGLMSQSLNRLSQSFLRTANFANQIEKGNLDTTYEKLSDKDQLGIALISMQQSLRNYARHLEQQINQRTAEVIEKSRKIEELKIFYESILSNIPIDITIMNENRKYMFVNSVAVHDAELRGEMLGKDDFELSVLHQNTDVDAVSRSTYFNQALLSGSAVDYEDKIIDKAGKETWKFHRFYPVSQEGKFTYMIDYGIDITSKKLQEIQIKDSLEEKEALLGEIHHRVKNNLTLVLGLIEMQIERQKDELIKAQYGEIKNRIYAMSLIHDKMYKSSSFANIDMRDYLKDLVNSISRFNIKASPAQVIFDIDEISVKNKDAVPIALLVNEIVTNAFKYAFNNLEKQGILEVNFKREENGYRLQIKDNGPGIPEGMDLSKSKSLGFKLINIFAKQLKGQLKHYNHNGLNFDISFTL